MTDNIPTFDHRKTEYRSNTVLKEEIRRKGFATVHDYNNYLETVGPPTLPTSRELLSFDHNKYFDDRRRYLQQRGPRLYN